MDTLIRDGGSRSRSGAGCRCATKRLLSQPSVAMDASLIAPSRRSGPASGLRAAPDGERRGPRRDDPGRESSRRDDFLAHAAAASATIPRKASELEDVAKAIEAGSHLLDAAGCLTRDSKGERTLHNLGRTRSSQQPNHLLLTPDTFVRAPLPGMKNCTAVVHVGPALGAAFTQYTAEFEAGGELGGTTAQRFVYVLEGGVKVEAEGQASRARRARLRLFPRRLGASRRRHARQAAWP